MRSRFAIFLGIAILFGAGYWYYTAEAICHVPLSYRIGTIDDQFDLTREEARAAASVAESIWEDGTGRNLFTYDESGKVTVNFVFDNRQAQANAEVELRDELKERQNESQDVRDQYEYLLEKYDDLKVDYDRLSKVYESELEAHNVEVERWNQAGGAPEDIYRNLENRQQELKKKQENLNAISYQLNQLAKQINAISSEGNSIVDDYNNIVEEYNTRFNESKEFTQGEFQDSVINIYQFDSSEDLEIVLAHEFGHALMLDHVEGGDSIMFHLMEGQSLEAGVTTQDKAEFVRVCGDGTLTLRSIL